MSLADSVAAYLATLEARCLARSTIRTYTRELHGFLEYLKRQGVHELAGITLQHTGAFLDLRKAEGMSASSLAHCACPLREWARFLHGMGYVERELHVPRVKIPPRRLPRSLSRERVAALLATPDTATAFGRRDRALLELAYSTGARAAELCAVNRSHLDLPGRTVRLYGKGRKERLAALGEPATRALREYLDDPERPEAARSDAGSVFLSRSGRRLGTRTVHRIVHKASVGAGGWHVHPHQLRHSFATHLVENGAPILAVRDLMGHSSATTTEIYLRAANTGALDKARALHPRR